jgi:hypothetical protein
VNEYSISVGSVVDEDPSSVTVTISSKNNVFYDPSTGSLIYKSVTTSFSSSASVTLTDKLGLSTTLNLKVNFLLASATNSTK